MLQYLHGIYYYVNGLYMHRIYLLRFIMAENLLWHCSLVLNCYFALESFHAQITEHQKPQNLKKMAQTTLFWIASILILEPLLAIAWPRFKVGFFLTGPKDCNSSLDKINDYYVKCRLKPFGTFCPLRRSIRTWMWSIGLSIFALLAANSIFNLNLLK